VTFRPFGKSAVIYDNRPGKSSLTNIALFNRDNGQKEGLILLKVSSWFLTGFNGPSSYNR